MRADIQPRRQYERPRATNPPSQCEFLIDLLVRFYDITGNAGVDEFMALFSYSSFLSLIDSLLVVFDSCIHSMGSWGFGARRYWRQRKFG